MKRIIKSACIKDTLSSRAALGSAFRLSASREQRYLAYNKSACKR